MKSFFRVVNLYFQGSDKYYARIMGAFLVSFSFVGVYIAYLFSEWNRRFYDALEAKNWDMFVQESLWFLLLVLIIVSLNALNKYYCQKYALRWRVWMTDFALEKWINLKDKSLEGSDQRIQEDIMRFTTIFEKYSLEIINKLLTMCTFIPLLFTLAKDLLVFGINIPGLLFYVILAYTFLGYIISRLVTRSLLSLEYNSQKFEASFRYHLVCAKDGKKYSFGYFSNLISSIIINHVRIYKKQSQFKLFQGFYDQFSFLIPFIILVPSFFAGIYTFGMVMQIKNIFSRVRNSIYYLLDIYPEVIEFQAISIRLMEFFDNLDIYEETNIYDTGAIIKPHII